MNLKRLKGKATIIETGEKTMLYSYSTLVALHIRGDGYYRTDRQYSVTTSKHLNQWLRSENAFDIAKRVSPERLIELAS